MKTVSIFLALINSLMAGLILAFSLSPTEIHSVPTWWLLAKTVAAGSVILIAVITWTVSIRPANAGVMALCSLLLVALGAATMVWTFHLALVSGDPEFYMALYGGSLIVQGMSSLFGFAGDPGSFTSL